MSLRGLGSLCALLLIGAAAACAQEVPSAPQPQPNAGQQKTAPATSDPSSKQASTDQQQASDDQNNQQDTTKKQPGRLKRALDRAKPNCIAIEGRQTCSDSSHSKQAQTDQAQSRAPKNQPAPRSEAPAGESSSRDTQIDLSPPPDDMTHEGADVTGVTEFHSYDPHKAAKNVEVGDFYYKRENYKAAESRYAEALDWKPNDAVATFKLAQSEEKLGKKDDALKNYQGYLKILPSGEFAAEAKSAIERLNK